MNHLISIAGPTAIGKTSLSIALAKLFSCPIISCDSRQFYKEMRIGTAVPSKEELAAVPHHFIQHISVKEHYNVGQFEKDALKKLESLFQKNKVVVMVGGSGLYFDAVLKGLDFFPDIDPSIRKQLELDLQNDGIETLQAKLEYMDPETYKSIDIQNPHRLIRALEVCLGSNHSYSYYINKPKAPRNFKSIKIGLDAERRVIYNRIEQRVDIMIEDGLVEEAKKLYMHKDLNALQTVGYRELFNYFDKQYAMDVAIAEIKKNTRRFAKRQNTWFKKDKEIKWFDYETNYQEIIEFINSKLH